jgi:hypothetical protein
MKTSILRIKAFALLVIIAIFFSAFNLKEKKDKSFLETYKGTLWKFGEPKDGLTIYAQINLSESDPFEIWLYDVIDDCYLYERFSESGSTKVLENRKNRVKIKIVENAAAYGIFTLTIEGNALKVQLDSFKNKKLIKEEQFTLNRSNDKIEQLSVCEN